ncbi:hypothetical protein CAP35_06490 [Chitinophagaceae bacterium IBVUCB1]|nr:hypothetical protein CAP35_06490 [Chitinophagaceae bacterium IBVUCB1]
MPVNKNLLARIRIINDCLAHSTRKYWSKTDLINRIEERTGIKIQPRTFDSDINKMKYDSGLNYNAPIEFDKTRDGYYYSVHGFSIDNLPLTEKDIEALEFATTTLSQFKEVKIFSEFAGAVDKLISLVNQIKYTNHESSFSFIDFEKAPFSKGNEYLDVLVDAIKNKIAVEIPYQKFTNAEIKQHIIHPYLLKEYRNRWYLLGLSDEKNRITTLALDRMLNVTKNGKKTFVPNTTFNADKYFENTIGINYENGKPVKVVLSFTPFQGNYLKTQFIHKSQKVLIDNDKEFRIELQVIPNYELASTILSHCDSVKVVSPISLKKKIAQIIDNCRKHYKGVL